MADIASVTAHTVDITMPVKPARFCETESKMVQATY